MALARGGYVKAFRQINKCKHFASDTERGWFLVMLTKAAWKELTVTETRTGQKIILQPGQVMRSVRKLAEDFAISEPTFRRFIQRLRAAGVVSVTSDAPGGASGGAPQPVITISKWALFQGLNGSGDAPHDAPGDAPYKESFEEEGMKEEGESPTPPSPSLRSGDSRSGSRSGGTRKRAEKGKSTKPSRPKPPVVPVYSPEFQRWWEAFPRRRGVRTGNKPKAFSLFRKLRKHFSLDDLSSASEAYARHEGGKAEKDQRVMDPDRFLNGHVQSWLENAKESEKRAVRVRERHRHAADSDIV